MVEVKGEFEVILTKAIDVAQDFEITGLPMCQYENDDNKITISPHKISEAQVLDGDYEPAKLLEIKVWILRKIDLKDSERKILSHQEEMVFEKILVESTRRLISIVKNKTEQWDLDSRHPVYAYSAKFWCGDNKIVVNFPLAEGQKRLPEYSHGTIIFSTRDLQGELSSEIWHTIVEIIPQPIIIPAYEELITDAKTSRSQMRYDLAVFYCAIASELMLEKSCESNLKEKHGLNEDQCEIIIGKMNVPELFQLIHKLDPQFPMTYGAAKELFTLRNKIAHGAIQDVEWENANSAIDIAEQLRAIVSKS
jgi:hypothetical protein